LTIWGDADSLPRDLRPILLRRAFSAARKGQALSVRFVASRKIPEIPADLLTIVTAGPDAADSFIESSAIPGDLVVTRDLPFAERMADREIPVLNDRGDLFTTENVRARRSLRDRMAELRALGLAPESPRASSRGSRETKLFADALDRALSMPDRTAR